LPRGARARPRPCQAGSRLPIRRPTRTCATGRSPAEWSGSTGVSSAPRRGRTGRPPPRRPARAATTGRPRRRALPPGPTSSARPWITSNGEPAVNTSNQVTWTTRWTTIGCPS
jgi:hypothetical protein